MRPGKRSNQRETIRKIYLVEKKDVKTDEGSNPDGSKQGRIPRSMRTKWQKRKRNTSQ